MWKNGKAVVMKPATCPITEPLLDQGCDVDYQVVATGVLADLLRGQRERPDHRGIVCRNCVLVPIAQNRVYIKFSGGRHLVHEERSGGACNVVGLGA